ncbi:MAG: nucleotidyltransferase domain-containing protein [Planctomycetota bacterium]|nr:nucleotidyltransferase domain-containing protein [Planctomycetota bacterium]MDP7253738.1 nucleotidyltransferase domain-containing protein [Planctomycetota bacterium]
MPQIESIAEMSDIQSVVRQIVNQFQPEKVILFGSYAYGKPSEDSDVDLLVVMDCEKRPIRVAAEISAAVDHAFPLDILVRKPDEFQESFERGGNFATEVLTEGHVLYEA